MRTLDCKRMTRLLPLYVAGDLVGEPEREVVVHLASCEECRQLADGFMESSSMLTQAYAQPEFDAEFYAGIRRAVLDKIPGEGIVLGPFDRLWGRRWLYAASIAVLVIATLTLQYFRSVPRQTSTDLVTTPQMSPQTITVKADPSSRKSSSAAANPRLGLAAMDSRQRNRKIESVRKPEAPNSGIARDARREIAPETANLASSPLEAVALSDRSAKSSSGPASSSEVSRIEIQTADPNIRIIWLAPRETRKSEETNHNEDPHESGVTK